MAETKPVVIRVTQTVDYMIDPKILAANGWTIEQLMEDWFAEERMRSYHATRDTFQIGGTRRFVSFEVVE